MPAKLEGMDTLLNQIAALGRSIDSTVKEKALKAGAEFLEAKIKDSVPVRTGKLKNSITASEVKDDAIQIGPAFADAFYGHFMEFGTSKMPAKPFMQPTFENNKEEIQEKMQDVIKRELNL